MNDPITMTANPGRTESHGRLRLLVLNGPSQGAFLDLEPGTYCIGKGPDCQLQLSDPRVSREHLTLHVSEHGVHVRDLGSKNGSLLGGTRLVEAVLSPGVTIQIGDTRLRLVSMLQDETRAPSSRSSFGAMYGATAVMHKVFALLEAAAITDASVLIEAETGCGKELCARAIHDASPRAKGPYVVCDLAGTTRSLLESELFGHVRGAFTGAAGNREGCFVEANNGTLFLDELGELDLDLQPRLLRALDAREVKPVGGSAYQPINIRVIAATNRDLEEEVREKRFREDLFYRLAVVRVRLPPLRERKEDVPALARIFIGDREIEFPPETMAVLTEYDWPGNIRELQNVITRGLAALDTGATMLEPEHLGIDGMAFFAKHAAQGKMEKQSLVEMRDQLIDTWERHYLDQLMARCEGNVSRAAREGGIDRVYLHRLLKRHGVGRWAR